MVPIGAVLLIDHYIWNTIPSKLYLYFYIIICVNHFTFYLKSISRLFSISTNVRATKKICFAIFYFFTRLDGRGTVVWWKKIIFWMSAKGPIISNFSLALWKFNILYSWNLWPRSYSKVIQSNATHVRPSRRTSFSYTLHLNVNLWWTHVCI